ncbi:FAD-dependent monooxygenase, partial [Bartonella apis]
MSSSATPTEKVLDLVIAGGAYVGLSLAVAVKQAVPSLKIAVIDAAPRDSWKTDPRASAIAAAAIRMLRQLQCWDEIESLSQPINDMIITDSRNSDPVRPVFLTFEGNVAPGEPFAYMVENKYLNAALHRRANELEIPVLEEVSVSNFTNNGNEMLIDLSNGSSLQSRLLVAADGVRSKLRDIADIKTLYWPYGQMG